MSFGAPLYEQIEQAIARQIFSGELTPGEALMPEGDLCRQYNVSRITVRRAVEELVRKRMLIRRRGVGTFVADPAEQLKTVTLTGYIEDVLPRVQFTVLSSGPAEFPATVEELVPDLHDKRCTRFVLLNRLEGKPFSYGEFLFPERIAKLLAADDFVRSEPPIRIVEARCAERVTRAVQRVHPSIASREIAAQLGVPLNTPVLQVTRVYFGVAGTVLEAVVAYYHPDRYRFTVELLPHATAQIPIASSSHPTAKKSAG